MTSSSYFLEKELLGSARNVIDANSNTQLVTSTSYTTYRSPYGGYNGAPYPSNGISLPSTGFSVPCDGSCSKKALADLQDQIHLLKQEVLKKDTLIKELSSIKDPTKVVIHEVGKYEMLANHERSALDAARRELDQCRIKIDGLTHDLRDATMKLAGKDERSNDMKHEIESLKHENEIVNQMNNQLRSRVRELETNMNSFDTAANKSSLTISSLQRDCKEKQEQLIELQSRIRVHLEEKESMERKSGALMNKLQELFIQIGVTLGTDFGQPHSSAFEKLVTRIADINAENTSLKGKMIHIEEQNRSLETENKANRATLQQMSNQLNNFEHGHNNHRLQIDSIRAERDAALHEKEMIKQELEVVKTRLDSIQKAWQNTRGELDSRETKFTSNELQLRQLENDLSYAKSCLDAFKQQIAQLLSDGYVKVEPKEEEIKEKVHLLMQSSKDRGLIITNLQNQKEQLSIQLQEQIEINRELDIKRKHSDARIIELEHRVVTLDNTFTTHEVYRENLKQDKAKFLHFLERLGAIMKVENVSSELGYELNPDVLLSRAEQLMKLECDSIVDQKTSIYSLQRRIKQLKEQLENKDVHMDLLRKKVIALEEGRTVKNDLEREIDDHVILSKKLKVKVEHLTQQVNQLKAENAQLKSQITDVQTYQGRLGERENEIRRLYEEIHKLEQMRDRQSVKISSLQERIHSVDDEANRSLLSSDNAVRTLSNELRFLKETLQQIQAREQNLLDFRALVARMLGLDVKTLAVPDYEITARLERLLMSVQPTVLVPTVSLNSSTIVHNPKPAAARTSHVSRPATASTQVYHHYPASLPRPPAQQRTTQPVRSANVRRRSPSPVSRRNENSQRARSLSPLHVGFDPRTY